jgi:hypothetical protein
VAQRVNTALVLLHWRMGKRILQDILKKKRAGYGEKIVSALRRQLERVFGEVVAPHSAVRSGVPR